MKEDAYSGKQRPLVAGEVSPMPPIRRMVGNIFGTNTGRLYLEFAPAGSGQEIGGRLRVNDNVAGLLIFGVQGSFDGSHLNLVGILEASGLSGEGALSENAKPPVTFKSNLKLNSAGVFGGNWEISTGNAGTLQLFPHDQIEAEPSSSGLEVSAQLHSQSRSLGVMRLALGNVRSLIRFLQEQLPDTSVIVNSGPVHMEVIQLAPEFLSRASELGTVRQLSIAARSKGPDGLDRNVTIELNKFEKNEIRASAGDQVWVSGILEALYDQLKQHEVSGSTLYRKHGMMLNSIVFFGLLIWLPGVEKIIDRAYFTAIAVAAMLALTWLHRRLVPMTEVRLSSESAGRWDEVWPSFLSSVLAAFVVAAAGALITQIDAASIFGEFIEWLGATFSSNGAATK